MVKPHISMKIYKVECYEDKGDQQCEMLRFSMYHWYRLNNADNDDYPSYTNVMNMETYRFNDEHRCYVATSNLFNPNKW